MSGPDWPGEERRRPPHELSDLGRALAARCVARGGRPGQRRARAATASSTSAAAPKPYYPFFAERASEYVGVDVVENPAAELRGLGRGAARRGRELRPRPLHAGARALRRPGQAVRELRRVTAPGRPRARLDARRPGLPPVAAGLLALDPRRPAAAVRRERGAGQSVDVTPRRGHGDDASRCCSARTPRSRSAAHAARARARSGCSTAPPTPSTGGVELLREPARAR